MPKKTKIIKKKKKPKPKTPKPDNPLNKTGNDGSFENSTEDEVDTLAYHQKKAKWHRENANRTYNNMLRERNNLTIDGKRVFDTCLKVAAYATGGIICSVNPPAAFLTAFTAAMIEYGLDNYKQYPYIKNQEYWCEYHTEMAEFHEEIIANYNLK